jgi:hypothetical protein
MDQLKVYLGHLKKHHFWVLLGLVFMLSSVAYYLGSNQFASEFEKNRSKIKASEMALTQIMGNFEHPNQNYIDLLKQRQGALDEEVDGVWRQLYQAQQQITVWPEWLPELQTLGPDEAMRDEWKLRYINRIPKELPSLMATLNLRNKVEVEASADSGDTSKGRQGKGKAEYEGLIHWDESQRQAFELAYKWDVTPSDVAVKVAQENLWIYRTLFDVLAKTNKEATEHLTAPIKAIERLDIAQAAAGQPSHGVILPGEGTVRITKIVDKDPKIPATKSTDDELLESRYVDDKGAPVPAATAKTGGGKEYRLVPFRLTVLMNQRKLPELLINLAEAELPLEVRRVRFNPRDSAHVRESSITGGSGPSTSSSVSSSSSKSGAEAELEKGPHDVPIEIRGVIYLFSPPVESTAPGGPGSAVTGLMRGHERLAPAADKDPIDWTEPRSHQPLALVESAAVKEATR